MNNLFVVRKKLIKMGPSVALVIPKQLTEDLGLSPNTRVKVGVDERKHGKFIWISKDEKPQRASKITNK